MCDAPICCSRHSSRSACYADLSAVPAIRSRVAIADRASPIGSTRMDPPAAIVPTAARGARTAIAVEAARLFCVAAAHCHRNTSTACNGLVRDIFTLACQHRSWQTASIVMIFLNARKTGRRCIRGRLGLSRRALGASLEGGPSRANCAGDSSDRCLRPPFCTSRDDLSSYGGRYANLPEGSGVFFCARGVAAHGFDGQLRHGALRIFWHLCEALRLRQSQLLRRL
jgi:hypothetical protein